LLRLVLRGEVHDVAATVGSRGVAERTSSGEPGR